MHAEAGAVGEPRNLLQGVLRPRHIGHDRGAGEHTRLDGEADSLGDLGSLAEVIGVNDERTARAISAGAGLLQRDGHAQNPSPQKPLGGSCSSRPGL